MQTFEEKNSCDIFAESNLITLMEHHVGITIGLIQFFYVVEEHRINEIRSKLIIGALWT